MKYINLFDTQADYDAAEKYYPNTSYIEASDEVVYQEIDPDYYLKQYLTTEALESGTFTFKIGRLVSPSDLQSISYSIDGGTTWTTTQNINYETVTITTPTIAQGGKVLWKGNGSRICDNSSPSSSISSTGSFNVSGNIMSLMYDNFADKTMLEKDNAFTYLFQNSNVVSAENLILPATTLTNYCYQSMFSGCTSLTTAPELPATTLANGCYLQMFGNCTSLTKAPVLPATTLATYCYGLMFGGCTSLTTAPELPATTLVNSCYSQMFGNCTSLTKAPVLPATTLTQYCYSQMFFNCTSLTTAPVLPATTLVNSCYYQMFSGCTQLNNIKMLATSIYATDCLQNWVQNVAATGTFTKDASATIPTGVNGIPENWTVVDA